MAINKHALIRYQVLDRCFRNPGRRFYIDDLLNECNEALNKQGSAGIEKRQLYDDIAFMESPEGWNIPLDKIRDGRKKYYRYEDLNFSISNQPINDLEAEQLKSAMAILQRFKGLPQFKWINELLPKIDQSFKVSNSPEGIISFDNNEFLEGLEYIDPLFNAILYKKALKVIYQSFKNPVPVEILFSPYHLKEYNNRWFVFGKDAEYENIINLALDRIVEVAETDKKYELTDIDFEEYFEDVLGVSFNPEEEPQKIYLRIDDSLWPYIRTKPFHGSQKVKGRGEGFVDICLELTPNYELESQILHYGEKVEVLEPEHFRKKIEARIDAMFEMYKTVQSSCIR